VNNATVQGTTTVNVNATDNVAVAKVELYADNNLLATDTSSPYTFSLNTLNLINGTHTLTAKAYDTSGNSATNSINVSVLNNVAFSSNVNCGGAALTYNGMNFQVDFGYDSGSTYYNWVVKFADQVYNTHRWNKTFTYNFTVPDGQYMVTLMFAEIYWTSAGQRIFNVAINNSQVVTNLDVYAQAGWATPYNLSFPVTITNGQLNILLTTNPTCTSNAMISGIQISKTN
jgi:hypothetical protein